MCDYWNIKLGRLDSGACEIGAAGAWADSVDDDEKGLYGRTSSKWADGEDDIMGVEEDQVLRGFFSQADIGTSDVDVCPRTQTLRPV